MAPVVGCPMAVAIIGLEEGGRGEDGLIPVLRAPKPLTPLANSWG